MWYIFSEESQKYIQSFHPDWRVTYTPNIDKAFGFFDIFLVETIQSVLDEDTTLVFQEEWQTSGR
jgi:hypothetical protein